MSFETWLSFCATEIVLCFIPGPAVLCVVSVALSRGVRPGLSAAMGILAANAIYFALSGTGVAAVILASNHLFTALKWAGAAYLFWIGLRMLFTSHVDTPQAIPTDRSSRTSFWRGFIVQGANPKAIIFFVALLPQFITPGASIGYQMLVLGVSSAVVELLVMVIYIALSVRARQVAGGRLSNLVERIGGAFLVAAAAKLAWVRPE